MEYLSKQRYDEIAAELNHLVTVVYPEVRDNVAETSAQGDRSENAGYREARRRQVKTISRIRFLQEVLIIYFNFQSSSIHMPRLPDLPLF